MTISRFHVADMDCGAEEQLVRMALSDIDGIDRIQVDLDRRDVVIDHNTSPATIGTALDALDLGTNHVDDTSKISPPTDLRLERNALILAFVINAGFFIGELAVGLISRSMGLIADALDMGADASVFALSLAAVGTAATRKKQLARLSGFLQLGLATVGLAEVIRRFITENEAPDATAMIVMSLLALAGNIATLLVLQRCPIRRSAPPSQLDLHRQRHQGQLSRHRCSSRRDRDRLTAPRPPRGRHHLRRRRQRLPPHPQHQPLISPRRSRALLMSGT